MYRYVMWLCMTVSMIWLSGCTAQDENTQQAFAKFAAAKQVLREKMVQQEKIHEADSSGPYYALRTARTREDAFIARVAILQQPEFSGQVKRVIAAGERYLQHAIQPRFARTADGMKADAVPDLDSLWLDFMYFVALQSPREVDALIKKIQKLREPVSQNGNTFWTPQQMFQQSAIIDILH